MEPINTKLLRQLLRTLNGIERGIREPVEQHKDATSATNPAQNHEHPPEPQAPIRVIRERTEADRTQEEADRKSAQGFQRKSLRVQWFLFIATALAFGAAAWYAHIAQSTLDEMHVQNVAQQRAILAVDGNPIPLQSGDIGLTIKNEGRLAATVTKIRMEYAQVRSNSLSLFRNKEEATALTVTSEDALTLSFTPPEIPRISKGERYYIRLDIDVFYDDGFGNTQHIRPCLSYDIPDDEWSQRCLSTHRIDLSKRLSTDIWLPPDKK